MFLIASLLIIAAAVKENRNIAILSFFLMIGGLALFCYGLTIIEDYESLLSGLSFITGNEYNVFFGEFSAWTWRLGNGFFIAIGAIAVTLVGIILKDR